MQELEKLQKENEQLREEVERQKRYRKCMYFNSKYLREATEYFEDLYKKEVAKNDELGVIIVGLIFSVIMLSLLVIFN